MKRILLILAVAVTGLFLAGCSDLQSEIATPQTLSVHKAGIQDQSSPDFHGNLVGHIGWDMDGCKSCHGTHYNGGTVGQSCISCHTYPAGPEACNTCHGIFADPSKSAPPRDLQNNTATTFVGVGAHAIHLYDNVTGEKVECSVCHTIPKTLKSPGHIDMDGRAEIVFSGLAMKRGEGVDSTVTAMYDPSDNTCANTYCHGYFKNGNLTNKVKWTDKANCGTCHGDPVTGNPLPGGTHQQNPLFAQNCQWCHAKTVTGGNGVYSFNKQNHINGVIDIN